MPRQNELAGNELTRNEPTQGCKRVGVVANVGGQLVDALPPLGVPGAVKQQALQGFNYGCVFFSLHDAGTVQPLATQVRVPVVVLVAVHAVAAVGAELVDNAADAHDLVGVVVHFQNEQRRFVRDVGLDGDRRLVNAGVVRVRSKPRAPLGPRFIVVPRDAHGDCGDVGLRHEFAY